MNAIARRLCATAIIVGLSLLATTPAWSQTCPTGSINPLAAYDNQSPSPTVINGNNVYVGNSRLRLTHTPFGSATIDSGDNRIDDDHIDFDIGVRLGHPGNANSPSNYLLSTYEFRTPNLAQALPVADLTFRIHDLDAADNITVNAYDQNGSLIALTPSMYSFEANTIVSRVAGTNRFTSQASNVGDLRGTVNMNFTGLQISRLELVYYDTSSNGTYTVASLRACNPTLTLYKATQLIGGGPFGFTLTNTTRNTGATVSTSAAGTPEQVDGNAATAGTQVFGVTPNLQATINESSVPTNWSLVAASTTCTNAGGTTIGSLSGTTYTIPAANTFAGAAITCTFTNAPPQADVQATKTATPNPVNTGQVVSYSIVVRNNGPNAVSNVLLTDNVGVGQNCSVPSTTATCTATTGATCPASIPVATLLGGGITVPTLAVNSQVTVTVQCTVTASGLP